MVYYNLPTHSPLSKSVFFLWGQEEALPILASRGRDRARSNDSKKVWSFLFILVQIVYPRNNISVLFITGAYSSSSKNAGHPSYTEHDGGAGSRLLPAQPQLQHAPPQLQPAPIQPAQHLWKWKG